MQPEAQMAYGFGATTTTTATTTNTTATTNNATTTTTEKETCVGLPIGQVADCVNGAQSEASEADASPKEGYFFKKCQF